VSVAPAERRFALLLVCAGLALAVLGVLTPRSAARPAAVAIEPLHPARAIGSAPVPGAIIEPILTVDLARRFPNLAPFAPPAPGLIPDTQIISYYGSLYSKDMGILGTGDLEEIIAQLKAHAAQYDALNGPTGVVAALHLVYAVAQYHPTDNGLYLQYVDEADLERVLDLTREHGLLLFLDIQVGRSSVDDEIAKVLPYLRESHVHLALDPEFAVVGTEVPGIDLGQLHAEDIDRAQAALQALVEQEGLPPKLLIVHQFADSMVVEGDAIKRYRDVDLIIDMDGFGPAVLKRAQYERYATQSYASHAGIKLFFEHDPDLMSESDVLNLHPRPTVVIYQ
jgi:hypothetical protein